MTVYTQDLCMCTLMCHDWQGRIQNVQKGELLHRGGRIKGLGVGSGDLHVHRGEREGGTILAASSFGG